MVVLNAGPFLEQRHAEIKQRPLSSSDLSDNEGNTISEMPQHKTIGAVDKAQFMPTEEVLELESDIVSAYRIDCSQSKARKWNVGKVFGMHKNTNLQLITLVALLFRSIGLTVSGGAMFPLIYDAYSYPADELVSRVTVLVLLAAVFRIMIMLSELGLYITMSKYADELSTVIRNKLLVHFIGQKLEYFDRHSSGALGAILATHPANIREIISNKLPEILTAALQTVVVLLTTVIIDVLMMLVSSFVIVATITIRLFETAVLARKEHTLQPLQADAAMICSEAYINLETVKAFSLESYFLDRYKSLYSYINREKMLHVLLNSILVAFGNCLMPLSQSISYAAAAYFMINNWKTTAFTLFSCQFLLTDMCSRCLHVLSQSRPIARSLASCTTVGEILNQSTQQQDLNLITPNLTGGVRLDDVNFTYPTRPQQQVLHNISFFVKAPKRIAIVGPSGSGKSSIFQLILALYEADSGTITASGTDVNKIDRVHLRRAICSVSQEPSFFSASVFRNIICGLDDVEPEQVYQAAQQAQIHDFILSLPEGYETDLGPQGGQLSGGQRQRLAIARALVRKPKLLLLDEATSALDSATETVVLRNLKEAEFASIMIAHRLGTVRDADKIIVVDGGRIVEHGTHEDLINLKGLYYTMRMSKHYA